MSAIPWMGPHVARPLSAHRPCRSLEHPRGGPGWQGVHVFPQRCAKAPTGELQVPRSCACMLCVYDYMANFFLTCWVAVTTTNESGIVISKQTVPEPRPVLSAILAQLLPAAAGW